MKYILRHFLLLFLCSSAYCSYSQCPGCKYRSGNLVANGDFEAGNTGFSSQYTHTTDLYPEGTYFIGTNANTYHADFRGRDHTTGAGRFMIANGETSPGVNVWCQTIAVTPNTDYSFSAWVCSVHSTNPALLQFSINGVQLGPVFSAPGTLNTWQEFFVNWNSGSNTTATICIRNQTTQPNGNDFGLDDISFSPCVPFTAAVTKTIKCRNSDDSLFVNATGGRAPYSYLWNNGATAAAITNLAPGTYTVTVTDFNGCTVTQSITVTAPQVPSISLSPKDATCPGVADGSITSGVSGGATPYAYSWSNGANTASVTNLLPGTYTLTVTDAKGCTATETKTIISGENPFIKTEGDTSICKGDNTILTASGSPGTYKWSTGSTSPQITVWPATDSIFIAELTNGSGCKNRDTILVRVSPRPDVKITGTDVSCNGTATGKAVATVSSGTPPFAYTWNSVPAQFTPDATSLRVGDYSCFVTDSNGCKDTATIKIKEPPGITFTTSVTNALCGSANGQATVVATGGTGTLTYRWNTAPAQTTSTATGLAVGSYTCTITDANNCQALAAVAVSNNAGPVARLLSKADNKCYGDSSGKATVKVDNATGTVLYRWNTLPEQNSPTAVDLKAGNYNCIVSDASNCSSSVIVSITEPQAISVATSSTPETCGQKNGSATVIASGGTGNLSYSWNTSPVQNTSTAVGLIHGNTYDVLITDEAKCKLNASVFVGGYTGPAVSLVGTKPVSCAGLADGAVIATVTGGTLPYDLRWNTTPVQYDTIASGLLPGNYVLNVTDANKCPALLSADVMPADTLKAILTVTDDACRQMKGSIAAVVSGGSGTLKYLWNTTPPQTTLNAVNIPAGTYTLTITDDNNCSAGFTGTVKDIPGPVITRVDLIQPLCVGQTGSATVTATGAGILAYNWNTTPPRTSAMADQLAAGQYTCRVTDANQCFADTTIVIASVNPLPIFSLGPDTAFCQGDSIKIEPDRAGDAYLWTTGETSRSIYVKNQGTYGLTLTAAGCSFTDDVFVREDTLPVFDLGNDSVFCGSFMVNLDITVTGNSTYAWSDGYTGPGRVITQPGQYWAEVTRDRCFLRDSVKYVSQPPISVSLPPDVSLCTGDSIRLLINTAVANPVILWNTGETSPGITVKAPGTYIAEITEGYCKASDSIVVSYNTLPVVNLGNDTIMCESFALLLGTNNPGFQHLWNTGETSENITINQPGIYSVTVTNFNCIDRDTIAVSYRPRPVFDLGNDTMICTNDKIDIGAFIPGASYLWNTGEQSSTITASRNETYYLTVTRLNCSFTDSLKLGLYPLPVIKIKDTTICMLDTILIDASWSGYRYRWENGDTVPVQIITGPSAKTLTVRDTNNCSASKSIRIPLDTGPACERGLYAPSAFTPDGDGVNDLFFLQGEYIQEISLDIYNRWGQLLFSRTALNPAWNGIYKGELAKTDVYAWRAVVTTLDKKKRVVMGKVTLLK